MRREAHEAASESCEKTGWGAPECPEKLSQVKSSHEPMGPYSCEESSEMLRSCLCIALAASAAGLAEGAPNVASIRL